MMQDAKKTRAQLLTELTTLRGLVDQIPAMVWTTDADFRLTSWTGGGLKALGLVPNQLVGLDIYEYFGTDDPELPQIRAHHRAIRGESVSYEVEFVGVVAQAHVQPLYDEAGEIQGVIGVAVDVTERKRIEAAHLAAIQRLEKTLHELTRLRRLLPTCLHCHRVRGGDDVWLPLEEYVSQHSSTVFSHGICPDCLPLL